MMTAGCLLGPIAIEEKWQVLCRASRGRVPICTPDFTLRSADDFYTLPNFSTKPANHLTYEPNNW